jgi:hypothetical protein
MEKRFMEVFNVVIDPTDPEEIKRQVIEYIAS